MASYYLTERTDYSFTLACLSVSVTILIRTNGPPRGGDFVVHPNMGGMEMQQSYLMSASNWTDEDADLPVSFEYIYHSTTVAGDVVDNVVKVKS